MGKGVWVPSWVSYATTALLPHSQSPGVLYTLQRGAAGGLVSEGKLAICGLELALGCVLFGLHSVLKET